ncbi:MAG: STM3941 family protein, partial [Terriglobia bacterium]
LTASGRELSGRVEIAANRMAGLLRLFAFVAFAALMGPALYLFEKGTLSPIVFGIVFGTPAAFVLLWFLWALTAMGPAMTLGDAGLSMQRGLCATRRLAWPEISGFELRTSNLYAFLVVHVRDAESLIAAQGVVGRWLMRQSQKTFGSPVRIPTSWLKCDRDWLLQTANDMLAAHGEQIESAVGAGGGVGNDVSERHTA